MLEELNVSDSKESDHITYSMIEKYRTYFRVLVKEHEDAEDLVQEVYFKLFKRLAHTPDLWNKIENKNAYIKQAARNVAFDMRRASPPKIASLDDEDNPALLDTLSDNGSWIVEFNERLDLEKHWLQLKNLMDDFSLYERNLIRLIYFEGYKPSEIAQLLQQPYEKISIDCNRAKAKLRGRLKIKLKKL